MPHQLRGTRPKTGLWRWLTNTVDNHYEVIESIQPTVDATRTYPLEWRYGVLSSTQSVAGPATMTSQVGPPVGKAWLISFMSILINPVRAAQYLHIHLKPSTLSGFGAGPRVALVAQPVQATIVANMDVPILGNANANAAANATGFHGMDSQIYLVGAAPGSPANQIQENLELSVTVAQLNDLMELRYRFTEFDIDVPPFS